MNRTSMRCDPGRGWARPPLAASRPGRRLASEALHALLVAGEPAEALACAARLRADGYTVAVADGLRPAMDLARAARPDLIFVCPGAWAGAAAVLRAMRADEVARRLPTVLVTDVPRAELAAAVGGLRPTESVVSRWPPRPPARSDAARPAGRSAR